MNDLYFSEREEGLSERDVNEISSKFWKGFVAFINKRSREGWFAEKYPYRYDLTELPTMTDELALADALRAHNISNPTRWQAPQPAPSTPKILDAVEFFGRIVSMPDKTKYDDHKKSHLIISFDREKGFDVYRGEINTMLRRCLHSYTIDESGHIQRVGPPVLEDTLLAAVFSTGDSELDQLLETARDKFQDPDIKIRKEALEKLWDAFERLKTINSGDKKASATTLLDATADPTNQPMLRDYLEKDARRLTKIGNNLMIRHTETDKEPITEIEHVDYLFHQMFALIYMIIQKKRKNEV